MRQEKLRVTLCLPSSRSVATSAIARQTLRAAVDELGAIDGIDRRRRLEPVRDRRPETRRRRPHRPRLPERRDDGAHRPVSRTPCSVCSTPIEARRTTAFAPSGGATAPSTSTSSRSPGIEQHDDTADASAPAGLRARLRAGAVARDRAERRPAGARPHRRRCSPQTYESPRLYSRWSAMKRTRPLTLVLLGLAGGGHRVLPRARCWPRRGSPSSRCPYSLSITLVAAGAIVVVLAVPIARAIRGTNTNPINPFRAMRIAVLAKASSMVGSLIAGFGLGFVVYLLSRAVVPAVASTLYTQHRRRRWRASSCSPAAWSPRSSALCHPKTKTPTTGNRCPTAG